MLKNLAFTMLTAVFLHGQIQNLYSRFSILLYSVGASIYQVV